MQRINLVLCHKGLQKKSFIFYGSWRKGTKEEKPWMWFLWMLKKYMIKCQVKFCKRVKKKKGVCVTYIHVIHVTCMMEQLLVWENMSKEFFYKDNITILNFMFLKDNIVLIEKWKERKRLTLNLSFGGRFRNQRIFFNLSVSNTEYMHCYFGRK